MPEDVQRPYLLADFDFIPAAGSSRVYAGKLLPAIHSGYQFKVRISVLSVPAQHPSNTPPKMHRQRPNFGCFSEDAASI